MKRVWITVTLVVALVLVAVHPLPSRAVQYLPGDLFAGTEGGIIEHWGTTGALVENLDTTRNNGFDTGMCFDHAGNLYATDFDAVVTKFNSMGGLAAATWATGSSAAESCVWNSVNRAAYVGNSSSDKLRQFDLIGTQTAAYSLATENRGVDWVDLSADQCTIDYTSEGQRIMRFNVCTDSQLADFGTVPLGSICYAVRIMPVTGEVFAACSTHVYRFLATGGAPVQTYTIAAESLLLSLSLDPGGTAFWTAPFTAGAAQSNIYKVDITTGAVLQTIASGAHIWGLALFGELAAAGGGPSVCRESDGNGNIKDDNSNSHTADNRDVQFNGDTDDNLICEEQDREEASDSGDEDQQRFDTHDNRDGSDFHAQRFDSLEFSQLGKKVTVIGAGLHAGYAVTFVLVEVDNGTTLPGFFSLQLSDGYNVAGSLVDGVITLG